jgi:anti-sigma factor RsiW
MDCETLATRLTDFLEGSLGEADHDAALEHLSTCASCEQVLAETTLMRDMLQRHAPAELTDEESGDLLREILGSLPTNEP